MPVKGSALGHPAVRFKTSENEKKRRTQYNKKDDTIQARKDDAMIIEILDKEQRY